MNDAHGFSDYATAADHQLREWVAGRPWHNPWAPEGLNKGGECCVDFSCCRRELLAPTARRNAYLAADAGERARMEKIALDHARVHKAILDLKTTP